MTSSKLKLGNSGADSVPVPAPEIFDHLLPIDEPRKEQTRDIFAGTLPRVLYAIALNPAAKFGSLEEQIVCLAQSFITHGSLFLPLFICDEEAIKSVLYREIRIGTECLDLRKFSWSQLVRLSRLISRHKITLVHCNFIDMLRNGYMWGVTLLHPRVKHFYTDHISRTSGNSLDAGWAKRFLKQIFFHRYKKVLCVSQFVLNDLQRQQIHLNLICCPQFINTDRFRPDAGARDNFRKKFSAESCFVVLTVAHLIKEKGIDVLIRAMAETPTNATLWIVGDGKESDSLRQLSSELHLTSRVSFHGQQKNVAPFMPAADCFVCPSLWEEAAGLVNMEAMASGLPAIASRSGGTPEYVEDGRTGFLFSPGDHHELARYMRLLQENPVLCREMSVQARAHALDKFTMDGGIRRYLELYQE